MHRVNVYRFYHLGQCIARIKEFSRVTPFQQVWWPLSNVRDALHLLINDPVPPRVCRSAAKTIIDAINGAGIPNDLDKLLQGPPTPQAPAGMEFQFVLDAIKDFEPVFSVECDSMDTYIVSKKGIYNTSDLIESADGSLPAEVLALLPEKVSSDLRNAGRCLAFDLNTACGFHLMRAAEAVIHEYYVTVTGHAMLRKHRNMGAYVRNLNKHKSDNPDSKASLKLIALIDQIREHHRNVLMHPEETLTASQALTLFGMCCSAIVAFVEGTELAR